MTDTAPAPSAEPVVQVDLNVSARTIIYMSAAPLAAGGTVLAAEGINTRSLIAAGVAALASLSAITAAAHIKK